MSTRTGAAISAVGLARRASARRIVPLGLFLPFFGLSVLVVLRLDQLVIRRVPALAARLNTS